jgi:RNA polymerase sigma-70 factor (ECF subfamily)
MTKTEEQQIIQAVLAGDSGQFEALVHAYEKTVYNLALRMLGDPQDALDASQETFFRAYRALASFRGDSKFSVWLYRLASNVCLDMLRKRSQAQVVSLSDEEGDELPIPDTSLSPEAALEKKELRRMVHQGLEQLDPVFRQALVLREINGLSYDEIATVTGLEPGTVKSRIFRARKKLAAILMEDGNFSPPSPSFSTTGKLTRKGGADHEQ